MLVENYASSDNKNPGTAQALSSKFVAILTDEARDQRKNLRFTQFTTYYHQSVGRG
jgi:hypothetical protein